MNDVLMCVHGVCSLAGSVRTSCGPTSSWSKDACIRGWHGGARTVQGCGICEECTLLSFNQSGTQDIHTYIHTYICVYMQLCDVHTCMHGNSVDLMYCNHTPRCRVRMMTYLLDSEPLFPMVMAYSILLNKTNFSYL